MQVSVGFVGYQEHTEIQKSDILQTCTGLSQTQKHAFNLTKTAIAN